MWLQWCIYTCWGNITVNITAAEGAAADNTNKTVILKIVLHLPSAYVR